jgi:hypothetical protein
MRMLDLFNREIIGWAMSDRIDQQLIYRERYATHDEERVHLRVYRSLLQSREHALDDQLHDAGCLAEGMARRAANGRDAPDGAGASTINPVSTVSESLQNHWVPSNKPVGRRSRAGTRLVCHSRSSR